MKNIKFNSAEEKRNIRAHLDLMRSSFALIIEGTENRHDEITKIERSYGVLFNQYKAPITIKTTRINRECSATLPDNLTENQRIKRFNAFKSIKNNRQRRLYEIIKERNGRTMPCLNQTLRARFKASAYFNATEQNTRDAGEELCAVVIHLMAKSAKVFNVHSVEFHLHFQKQLEKALGKKLASVFPSALNKKGELKKTATATLKRLNDKKTCRNNFNRHVKAELLHDDMRLKNIGDTSSEKAKKRQKDKSMSFSAYAGERSIKKRQEQQEYRDKYLKSKVTKSGKSAFEMQKTKAAHFSELYLEMLALEEIAKEKAYTWLFITPTCPSEYHSNPSEGKLCWKGATAKESHEYLQGQWTNLGKSFTKKIGQGLKFGIEDGSGFGKRVVEPHASGCAHWHIMLFCKPECKERYKELFKHYFEHSDGKGCDIIEKGLDENGKKIDGEEASAASYMLKYMAKTNGAELKEGKIKDGELTAVDAWKHATGIRSHAPFGYKGVKTKYTDCRKIANKHKDLFIDVINTEEKGKRLKKAKKAFFIRALKEAGVPVTDLTKAENFRSEMSVLIDVIKTSSAKTKKSKSGTMGSDYKTFMSKAKKISYTTKEDINRFGERVLKKAALGTENSTINLIREDWKSDIKGIQINSDDLLSRVL
ncbi:replication endonuclease [Vibrio vulnificus]|nr:replication endonuclease [Vibrio vulnificus]